MKQFLTSLIVACICFACNSNTEIKNTTDTAQVNQQKYSVTQQTDRTDLITAMQKLKKTLATNNAATIADVFPFPLKDSLFSVYSDDDDFNAAYSTNSNSITKDMFLQHYDAIAEVMWLDDINTLLNKLPIDSLNQLNEITTAVVDVAKPCYREYQITVENKQVTLSVNIKSNNNYVSKKKSNKDEPAANSSEMCDSSLWWIFTIDGKELKLTSISGAG